MARETGLLAEVLDLSGALRTRAPDARHAVHLLSSAGGLFEGQTFCDAASLPAPLRPYGAGKLRQEALARALAPGTRVEIYRPSSVYGVSRSGRVGLVTALIGNALRGATTRIVGHAGTLRDYVHAEDVGRFLAARVAAAEAPGPPAIHLLARGRPAAMTEVIAHVERALDARLRLQFDPAPGNARDMSFRPSALPAGWSQVDLGTGIAQVARRLRQDWAAHA
jgi:UDP-glucose 4-epimerase